MEQTTSPDLFPYTGFETLDFPKEFSRKYMAFVPQRGVVADIDLIANQRRELLQTVLFPAIVAQVFNVVELCKSIPPVKSNLQIIPTLFDIKAVSDEFGNELQNKIISNNTERFDLKIKIQPQGQIKKLFLVYGTYTLDLTTNDVKIWLNRPDTVEDMLELANKIWVLLDNRQALVDMVRTFINGNAKFLS